VKPSRFDWVVVLLLLAACGHKADENTTSTKVAEAIANQSLPDNGNSPAFAKPASFSIDSIPISTVPLGSFPYFSLPDGYKPMNPPETRDFGHFPFWTGTELHDVEGKLFMSFIDAKDGKTYSDYELKKNIEAVLKQAGGQQLTDSKIPSDVTDKLPEDVTVGMNTGLGDVYNDPTETWVIRRPDRQIWVHFVAGRNSASWTILETKPFVQSASLLPADALKQDIDKTGKAIVHVNFATDRTQILPDSQPQIDAITTLLKQSPDLRLAVNGYTDETGSAAHNQSLSEGRAKAVLATLISAGILPDRLKAKGFGATSPIAANDSEDGKAKNRRVELVKFQ